MATEGDKILMRLETDATTFTRERKRFLWRSRETVLKILADRGITDTAPNLTVPFEEFEAWIGEDSELDIMNCMTMNVKKDSAEKTCVMWIPTAGVPDLARIATFAREESITNVLVVVCDGDIKHPAKGFVNDIIAFRVYFQLYTISELQYNIAEHCLVPQHTFATKHEIQSIKREYNITKTQFPKILRDDVMVRHLAAKQGDVLKIKRPSETAPGYYDFVYRVVT